jgi:hypothetical protein
VAYSERLCGSGSKVAPAPERDFGSLDGYPDATTRPKTSVIKKGDYVQVI